MKKLVLALFLVANFGATAQVKYWVFFADKPNAEVQMAAPENYLSQRALDRRTRQNIDIKSSDVPVHQAYIDLVNHEGAIVLQKSRWLNGVSVFATQQQIAALQNLPFVTSVLAIKSLKKNSVLPNENASFKNTAVTDTAFNYGASSNQIFMMGGQFLHNNGSRGQGMLIAVLDGGFTGANLYAGFDSLWARNGVLVTKNFVAKDTNVFLDGSHGMSVLSILAGNVSGQLIGSAPYANYLLLKSEDQSSETQAEEDNWVAAAEYADSAGADIITSSLGYTTFDGGIGDYTQKDLDGRTAICTQGAVMAHRAGILVVNSAGNEGAGSWQKILTPADADSILAVGGVDLDRNYVLFSSQGPSADKRIKPDVSAKAQSVTLINANGVVGSGNGTSFSAPLVSGLAACLWQRHPTKTNYEIRQAIIESASQYFAPDSLLGYGIPNFQVADFVLGIDEPTQFKDFAIYPNPFLDGVVVKYIANSYPQKAVLTVVNSVGQTVFSKAIVLENIYTSLQDFSHLASGNYIFSLAVDGKVFQQKMVK